MRHYIWGHIPSQIHTFLINIQSINYCKASTHHPPISLMLANDIFRVIISQRACTFLTNANPYAETTPEYHSRSHLSLATVPPSPLTTRKNANKRFIWFYQLSDRELLSRSLVLCFWSRLVGCYMSLRYILLYRDLTTWQVDGSDNHGVLASPYSLPPEGLS